MFKKSKRIYIAIFVLLFFLISGMLELKFSTSLKNTLEDMQYKNLQDTSFYNNQTISANIENIYDIIEMVTENVAYYKDKPTDELCAFLKTVSDSASFDRIAVTNTEGNAVFSDKSTENIAHRWYFKKALSGSRSIEGPIISVVSGNPIIVFAAPIHEGQDITGIVHATYELQNIGENLLKSEYHTIITDTSGNILFCNVHNYETHHQNKESDNILNIINKDNINDDYDQESLFLDLASKKSGTFEFTKDGQTNYVFYSPTGINDWYSFQIIPDSGILTKHSLFNKIALSMVAGYVILICLLFVIIFFLWRMEEKKIKNRITKEKEHYFDLLSHIQGGVVILKYPENNDGSTVTYLSNVFKKMTGYTEDEIREQFNNDITNLIHPADNPQEIRKQHKTFDIDKSYQLQYRLQKKDGTYVWVMDLGYIYLNNQGERVNQILFSDIDILKQHETELQLNAESMKIATNLINGGVFEYDITQDKFIILENIYKTIGKKNESLFQNYQRRENKKVNNLLAFLYFIHPNDRYDTIVSYKKLMQNGTTTFQARLNKDDMYIWCKFHLTVIYDSENHPMRIIGNLIDVNDTKCQMDKLQNMAERDPLTGLLNRQAFVMHIEKILNKYPENNHAFFLLDIDNFKGINDTYGHVFGDFILKNLAKSLIKIFDTNDIICRMGGDEFIVFMTNIKDICQCRQKAEQICNLYKNAVSDGKNEAFVSYSVGISVYNNSNRESRSTLYLQADSALYESKENGKNRYTFYTKKEI